MKVHFYSIARDSKVDYITEAEAVENVYLFKDESLENTFNKLIVYSDYISLIRNGQTEGEFHFKLGKRTKASYKNQLGLMFDFLVYTKRLEVTPKKIIIEYDFFIDGEYQDTIKIYLILK